MGFHIELLLLSIRQGSIKCEHAFEGERTWLFKVSIKENLNSVSSVHLGLSQDTLRLLSDLIMVLIFNLREAIQP